ncbi:Phosphoserine phosphatase 1 [Baekduia alba]|uniref:histidine phosphatase family protein n=1 Tax=Baekduia alba TaxID=2997333 RepID=UPI002341E76E|nr:histidine phosphatase family protein [Baekduia alba]WCB94936.1 Phosphoserine phosphatase 1 [Baekduia alba]
MRRLLLVRHAPTAATRAAAFATDEPLDERARAAAGKALPSATGSRAAALSSPSLCCRQTAEAGGLAPLIVAAIAECDFGRWAGRTLTELAAQDPAAVERWLTDPDATPHGGESVRGFGARVAGWLDEQASEEGTAVAVTHAGVVKAAVVHALDAPLSAFWRIDAAPLSVTELHLRRGCWSVARLNHALTGRV